MVRRVIVLSTECRSGSYQVNLLNLIKDGYERKARLYPALLLIAPVLIMLVGVASAKLSTLESLGAAAVGCGGAFLLTQLARDAGKQCEKSLFDVWGGMPSIAILRHRDSRIDAITKTRYHSRLSALVKGAKAPTPKEEAVDPAGSDQVYSAWSSYLRGHTRDTKKYPLPFQENVSYGYRRNVYGLRPIGLIVGALSFTVGAAWLYYLHLVAAAIAPESVGALGCVLVILLLWVFRFTRDWVRIPADAYAERLVEAIDSMGSGTQPSKSRTNKGTT
jgi:hypothetical protein